MSQVAIVGSAGTVPPVFRLIGPTVTTDATGGAVQVNANKNFNTNLPIDKFMLVRQVDWFVANRAAASLNAAKQNTWQMQAQVVESLGRTSVNLTDPNYVDDYFDEMYQFTTQVTAAGIIAVFENRLKAQWSHYLSLPWATAAQQLNLVASLVPGSVTGGETGPKFDFTPILYYELISLTADIRSYLATRIQIASQV